ncbi:putative nucleotidyltransferase, ribonuclease H [Tanacetum coccineum]
MILSPPSSTESATISCWFRWFQQLYLAGNQITSLTTLHELPNLEENPILEMAHVKAASVLLVGPTLKKFNDRGVPWTGEEHRMFLLGRSSGRTKRRANLFNIVADDVIPEIYNEEAYNGNSALYITSSNGYLYKVTLERPNEGLWYLSGTKWTKFCNNSLNENVALLHFIEEGDDSFYVTGYTSNGNEVGGYEANRATFSWFMTRVLPYPNLPQTIPVELLPTLKELDEIDIQANSMSFTGYVRRQELALKTGTHVYELGDTWNTLVKSLGLEAGMICVLTKNRGNKMWLEAFNNDGSMITNVVFKGAATLRHEQLTLTKSEKCNCIVKSFAWMFEKQAIFVSGHEGNNGRVIDAPLASWDSCVENLGELVLSSVQHFISNDDSQRGTNQTLEICEAGALEWIAPSRLLFSPFREFKRFGIKGKLSPRFIGPFDILERIGEASYRLTLPPQLSHVYNVFHVSLLRGYHYHPLHVASYPFDQIQPDMSLSEEPESILDRQERVMRNKVIPFVKILWKNHPEREATWETEESMRASYPHFLV